MFDKNMFCFFNFAQSEPALYLSLAAYKRFPANYDVFPVRDALSTALS